MIVGQSRAVEQFASAWASRKLHHAWLLAGPRGVGKATFAHAAARRVLADAAAPSANLPGIEADIAKSLVERAHQLCPYSKATRGNIAVELNVV